MKATTSTNTLLLTFAVSTFIASCKKAPPFEEKNQEVKATVANAADDIVIFNAIGTKADMGRYYLPATFSISAINEANAWTDIEFDPANTNTPGTYPFSYCQYRIEKETGAIYINNSQNRPGTITIKTCTGKYVEGSFSLIACQ